MARRVSRRKNVRRKLVSRGRRMQSQGTMPLYYRRSAALAASKRIRGALSRGFKRRAQPQSSTTVKRRRSAAPMNYLTELSKSKKKVYMGKYSLSRVVNTGVNRSIERWQNISNFDNDNGANWLANYGTAGGRIYLPMMIIDCGSIRQPDLSAAPPPAVYSPYWSNATTSASINMDPLTGQNPDGGSTSISGFQFENDNSNNIGEAHTTAILDWVNLRVNLYGQRIRTTKFLITVFQVTQDEVDITTGSAGALDKIALMQYLERPFVYSNLQQDNKLKKTGYKVIKEFTYNVAPMSTTDLNTTTGNIHEANIYVKINKKMDYVYTKNTSNIMPHTQEDGKDYTVMGSATSMHNAPKPKQNVYIAIRAFAPSRVPQESLSSAQCPSVDLIVRRGMTFAS